MDRALGVRYGLRDGPEVKAHIFEPFFTTKEPGKGTGLGLSTVYAVVMQGGGHVTVRSDPGRGASFLIRLPCVQVGVAPQPPVPGSGPRSGTETILLVEDEGTLLDMAARILEGHGYRVIGKNDPMEALALFTDSGMRADLLLTDVVMPGLNGRELAERILPAHAGMKVLFISGYPVEDILPPTVLGRKVEFLQKPFLPDDLAGKVRAVLDG
jgi:two-component system, cell cycle sensor histidine kinase and response regulator CckA